MENGKNELKEKEMEQVSGGNLIDDAKEALKKIFREPANPDGPAPKEPATGRGKC